MFYRQSRAAPPVLAYCLLFVCLLALARDVLERRTGRRKKKRRVKPSSSDVVGSGCVSGFQAAGSGHPSGCRQSYRPRRRSVSEEYNQKTQTTSEALTRCSSIRVARLVPAPRNVRVEAQGSRVMLVSVFPAELHCSCGGGSVFTARLIVV